MKVDFELYRQEVIVSRQPRIRLSVIDISPERPLNTIVMLHGFGGNATQWMYQLRAFSDLNRCIAIDLRGHGRSDAPASDYTVDEMLDDVQAVLARLDVYEPVVLMGHSFGGGLATSFAYRYPEQVKRLVLTATATRYSLPFYSRALLSLPVPVLNVIRPFVKNEISAPPVVIKRFFRNAMDPWDGAEMMRRLTMPVLVIRGDRDLVFPQASYEEVARLIPHAEDVNLGVSKHMVILERHDAVERVMMRFLGLGGESWRSSRGDAEKHMQLLAERPWLNEYEAGVPFTLSIPRKPLHSLLTSAANRFPNRTATVFLDRKLTYRQVERQANRLANALRGVGVDTGTRVMILLPNTPQWVIALYGVLRAGGVVVGASPISPQDEILREIDDSQAQVLITLTRFQETARAALDMAGLEHVIYTNVKDYLGWQKKAVYTLTRENESGDRLSHPLRENERRWVDLMRGYHANPLDVNVAPENVALIQYTGGTTANPKGVMLSHRALVANAIQTRHWYPDLKEGRERVLCVVPFGHIYGMTAAMNLSVTVGAAMIILPNFVTEDVLKAIKHYRVTVFPGVPTMYVAINNFPGVRRFGLNSIRACISGAAPLPVEVQETFEKLTKGRLVEGYGLTEAGPVTHANSVSGPRKVGSIGVPLPGTEARIVHLATGHSLPVGEIGELAIRGPQIMDGYWDMPEATAQTLRDGWLLTGDIARMDAEGYFQIISRKKDMWYPERGDAEPRPAFPRDVEEVIYELPEVKETAVVGVGTKAIAFVTVKRNIEPGTIVMYCMRRLPAELVPVLVIIVEEMPKSFVGKIIRRALLDKIPERQRRELDIISDRIDEMLDYPFSDKES